MSAGGELVFAALGGAGEIGMNASLYGFGPSGRQRWLLVDLGITFGGGGIPGVDVMMPDPAFIAARRDALEALILTHAHEDHLGAVAYLWPRLRCPVYASPFAQAVLQRKLAETGLDGVVPVLPLPETDALSLGPFSVAAIGMTHSIPEAHAIVIRTEAGVVVHSGDWKLDCGPVIGRPVDEAALSRLGCEGVLALVCDSTNVFEQGRSGSEASLLDPLTALIHDRTGRVVVTCFSTNLARIETIAAAARRTGREVVLTGTSLLRNVAAGRECGYLAGLPPLLDGEGGRRLPRQRALIVCTGGQGERNAALSRLAFDEHPTLDLEAGDAVIFSSRVIPGNELAIGRVHNQLLRRGIAVITHRQAPVHVSGHPARDELARLYALLRPRVAVPVHGELRHMQEHAALARSLGVPETVVAENGGLVRLAPGPAGVCGRIEAGRLAREGRQTVSLQGPLIRNRAKALYQGAAFVTVVAGSGARTRVRDVRLSTIGLLDGDEEGVHETVCADVRAAIDALAAKVYIDDARVRETTSLVVRRAFRHMLDKRPVTAVHLVRVRSKEKEEG